LQSKAREHLRQLDSEIQELEDRALKDSLTGLPDVVVFKDRLEASLKRLNGSGDKTACLFVDLDDFAKHNQDGHDKGNAILRRVSDRLQTEVGDEAFLARFGGDEFTVTVPHFIEFTKVQETIRRINNAFSTPIEVNNEQVFVDLSIGVSIAPIDTSEPEEMIHYSSISMKHAKQIEGRQNWCYYTLLNQRKEEISA
jgi:diguanylate cyclase (GGDEF)-like protein